MTFPFEKLNDIEGLDAIPFWPLAIGWWIVIGFTILILCALVYFLVRWILFKRSWKSDTRRKLNLLEKNLSEDNAREAVVLLADYLRRIAIKSFSRKECASLFGENWLKWLSKHDPKKFDWVKEGKILVTVPYSASHVKVSIENVKKLIQATKYWV